MKNDRADRAEDLENNEAARSILLAAFLLVSLSIALLLSIIYTIGVCLCNTQEAWIQALMKYF